MITNKNQDYEKGLWQYTMREFLEAHQYQTDFAIKRRQPEKEKRIKELKEIIES